MVRWLNHAMPFAMVFAIIAIFAVKLRWVRHVRGESSQTSVRTAPVDALVTIFE